MARILVLDDEHRLLRTLLLLLRNAGHEALGATRFAEIDELLYPGKFDVLITDLEMPRTSGMELFSSVRETKSKVPFIFVTGKPTLDTAMEAMNQGAFAYIQKPFEPEQVMDAVNRATATLQTPASTPPPKKAAHHRFDSAIAGLHVHYQPIVRWSSQRAFSYEALMRTS